MELSVTCSGLAARRRAGDGEHVAALRAVRAAHVDVVQARGAGRHAVGDPHIPAIGQRGRRVVARRHHRTVGRIKRQRRRQAVVQEARPVTGRGRLEHHGVARGGAEHVRGGLRAHRIPQDRVRGGEVLRLRGLQGQREAGPPGHDHAVRGRDGPAHPDVVRAGGGRDEVGEVAIDVGGVVARDRELHVVAVVELQAQVGRVQRVGDGDGRGLAGAQRHGVPVAVEAVEGAARRGAGRGSAQADEAAVQALRGLEGAVRIDRDQAVEHGAHAVAAEPAERGSVDAVGAGLRDGQHLQASRLSGERGVRASEHRRPVRADHLDASQQEVHRREFEGDRLAGDQREREAVGVAAGMEATRRDAVVDQRAGGLLVGDGGGIGARGGVDAKSHGEVAARIEPVARGVAEACVQQRELVRAFGQHRQLNPQFARHGVIAEGRGVDLGARLSVDQDHVGGTQVVRIQRFAEGDAQVQRLRRQHGVRCD
jgi:hypothetical protein